MLAIDQLEIGYRSPLGPKSVAKNISLRLEAGEFVCLLGPNGAGKSTLMRTIAGMQPALSGTVALDGIDVRTLTANQRAARLSVVLTERVTAGLLTGYAMACLGRYPHTGWFGKLNEADHEAVRRALRLARAEAFSERFVGELSDGERQRVMMARALAQEPRLMILDEITAFLDLPRRIEMMTLLRDLAHDGNRTVLISTHDLDLALRTADRIWLMRADGTLSTGAPEDLVLNGSFATAFAEEGIAFDPMRGAFSFRQESATSIRLVGGNNVQREWTARALERAGCKPTDDSGVSADSPLVEILDTEHWRLTNGSTPVVHDSLHALVGSLRNPSGRRDLDGV